MNYFITGTDLLHRHHLAVHEPTLSLVCTLCRIMILPTSLETHQRTRIHTKAKVAIPLKQATTFAAIRRDVAAMGVQPDHPAQLLSDYLQTGRAAPQEQVRRLAALPPILCLPIHPGYICHACGLCRKRKSAIIEHGRSQDAHLDCKHAGEPLACHYQILFQDKSHALNVEVTAPAPVQLEVVEEEMKQWTQFGVEYFQKMAKVEQVHLNVQTLPHWVRQVSFPSSMSSSRQLAAAYLYCASPTSIRSCTWTSVVQRSSPLLPSTRRSLRSEFRLAAPAIFSGARLSL